MSCKDTFHPASDDISYFAHRDIFCLIRTKGFSYWVVGMALKFSRYRQTRFFR
ncbi:Uncharacterised protein [Vibrio cholerae]|nr:Uncharacterised protein [Vibrio cholerae]